MNSPSAFLVPNSSRVFGLGVAVKAKVERLGSRPRSADLLEDLVLDLVFGRLGARLLPLGLLEAPRRQHRLQALGALARLRGVRLVHDDGETLPGEPADLLGDHRELLERGDDDRLARLQRLLELARGAVDVLDHAEGLLELADGLLELSVEDPAVGHHHDRVEDAAVVLVVQGRELVGEPSDGEALAATGRVLDQIALPGTVTAGVAHQSAHAIELLIARKDQEPTPGLAAFVVLVLHLVDEPADQVEDAVARPDPLPEVVGGVARPGRRHRGVARATVATPVERQKAGLLPGELRRHEDQLGVDGEVRQAAAIGQERLPRVALVLVLPDRVLDVLARERVLQLGGEDREPVEKEREVEALRPPSRGSGAGAPPRRGLPRAAAASPR